MLALIQNGNVVRYPYSEAEFRRDNAGTSFPENIPDKTLAEYGAFRVFSDVHPPYDPTTQKVEEGIPFFNGYTQRWTQSWKIVDMTQQEIELRTAARADQVRDERNRLIAESDWTQLQDTPVNKETWAIYRQALRDIPEQSGFPWNVEWPTKPE